MFKNFSSALAGAALFLAGSVVGASAAPLLYGSTFPTSSFGGPCSPCSFGYRVYDLIDLGATNNVLTKIEFAIHDITSGGAGDINVSFFDTSETLLHSVTQNSTQWSPIDAIDGDNYTVSFSLPDLTIASQSVYVSIFGVSGTQFGLFRGGGGDGIATQLASTTPSGFAGVNNLDDVAIRVYGGAVAPVPLPAGLPLLVGALGGLAIFRRRKAA